MGNKNISVYINDYRKHHNEGNCFTDNSERGKLLLNNNLRNNFNNDKIGNLTTSNQSYAKISNINNNNKQNNININNTNNINIGLSNSLKDNHCSNYKYNYVKFDNINLNNDNKNNNQNSINLFSNKGDNNSYSNYKESYLHNGNNNSNIVTGQGEKIRKSNIVFGEYNGKIRTTMKNDYNRNYDNITINNIPNNTFKSSNILNSNNNLNNNTTSYQSSFIEQNYIGASNTKNNIINNNNHKNNFEFGYGDDNNYATESKLYKKPNINPIHNNLNNKKAAATIDIKNNNIGYYDSDYKENFTKHSIPKPEPSNSIKNNNNYIQYNLHNNKDNYLTENNK